MKAKVNGKCHVSFFAWAAETRSTIKVMFIFYFSSDPESEPEPESETIMSPESESESEQSHPDSALVHLKRPRSTLQESGSTLQERCVTGTQRLSPSVVIAAEALTGFRCAIMTMGDKSWVLVTQRF